jgi:hypothetical protein
MTSVEKRNLTIGGGLALIVIALAAAILRPEKRLQ